MHAAAPSAAHAPVRLRSSSPFNISIARPTIASSTCCERMSCFSSKAAPNGTNSVCEARRRRRDTGSHMPNGNRLQHEECTEVQHSQGERSLTPQRIRTCRFDREQDDTCGKNPQRRYPERIE